MATLPSAQSLMPGPWMCLSPGGDAFRPPEEQKATKPGRKR
jgi:hypothetical protein